MLPFFWVASAIAQQPGGNSALASKEFERRQASVQEGQILLLKGDEAYNSGRYKDAAAAFLGARQAFPDAEATADLRAAATERYAQASVELARELSRKGDVEGAKETVDKVLEESVAPGDLGALAFRADLDDPIRTNPALDKKHAADVDQVRRLLYMAQGAFDLGKYDESKLHYEDVLRIDPYNTAARRGMERLSSQKSGYFKSAYDQTRGEVLSEVDSAWELPLAPNLVIPSLDEVVPIGGQSGAISLSSKLKRIMIPDYRLDQGTLMEAVELLRLRASENDVFEADTSKKGINFAVNLGDVSVSPGKDILGRTFDLRLSNVPVEQILKYITDITGTAAKTDDFAVTIVPSGSVSNDLVTRSYRVPPDFLSNLSAGASGDADGESDDIFNTDIGSGGLLAKRMGAQEALALQGVTFPEGASASFNGATNTLRIVNTSSNQDVIEQIVQSIAQTEPVSVAVRVTILKVEKNRLEELGFDWMLGNFGFGRDAGPPGVDSFNLSGGTAGNGALIGDVPGTPGFLNPANPLTAGNRSGDGAFSGSTIDTLIAAGTSGGIQSNNRAPGVFGVNGVFGNTAVQMLMRGLDQKKGVDMMAQPSVTTRTGQAASILLVDEFIYPTEYEPPELPNTVSTGGIITIDPVTGLPVAGGRSSGSFPVTPATPTAFEKRDVGVALEILPVADANRRYVDITLNPSVTEFDGFVNYGSPIQTSSSGLFGAQTQVITPNAILLPIFSVQRTNTNMVVADGATIVIGGLMRDVAEDVEDKTPILGDIPVVGRLFQSSARKQTTTAILFLVNVELLDPTGRPYRDR